ncbi:MAG: VWA domain-containing protein [Acidimicrobiales bacterium]
MNIGRRGGPRIARSALAALAPLALLTLLLAFATPAPARAPAAVDTELPDDPDSAADPGADAGADSDTDPPDDPDPDPGPDADPDAGADGDPDLEADADLAGRIQILGVEESEDEVILEVAVPPAIGQLAPIDANFGVTDGGRLVGVAVAPIATAPDTVIVLDTSGSMRGSALAAAKAAAGAFIQALPDDARVGLISFGETVVVHSDPTLDRDALLADVDQLVAGGEETVLWDALSVAAEMVGRSAAGGSPIGGSSAVVLSDGDDTASTTGPADVVRSFEAGSTPLYAVAIESPDTDLMALEQTVAEVGGQFLATTDLGRLDSLYTDIAGRLANRYRLRFPPAQDGERTVVVSVAAGGSVATASTTIGRDPDRAVDPVAPGPDVRPEPPPRLLNVDDQPALGAIPNPGPGPLAGATMLWVGLGSMFGAFVIAGLLAALPAAQVRLDAAAGADRVRGINARLGQAADQLISRHDQGSRIDARLEAADINLRPGEFVLAWVLATVVIGLAVSALVGLAPGILVVVGSVIGGFAFLGVRANRRRSRFADQLTETLAIMASSLRAGQSLPRSIELVAVEAPSPTAEQFHRISFEIRVGRDLTESIRGAANRMASQDLEWLAQAVDIHRELGGDLSEIMDNVASTIRERRTVARQIEALSAEGRATAWILLGMPVAMFLFAWWRTPDNIATMMSEPLGRLLLIVAASGMVIGHFWIRHLVKLKF